MLTKKDKQTIYVDIIKELLVPVVLLNFQHFFVVSFTSSSLYFVLVFSLYVDSR